MNIYQLIEHSSTFRPYYTSRRAYRLYTNLPYHIYLVTMTQTRRRRRTGIWPVLGKTRVTRFTMRIDRKKLQLPYVSAKRIHSTPAACFGRRSIYISRAVRYRTLYALKIEQMYNRTSERRERTAMNDLMAVKKLKQKQRKTHLGNIEWNFRFTKCFWAACKNELLLIRTYPLPSSLFFSLYVSRRFQNFLDRIFHSRFSLQSVSFSFSAKKNRAREWLKNS